MLKREIYKTEFILQEDNLEREVIRQIAPEYDNLILEKDNLIDRYENQKAKNIDVDTEEFYKKLSEINDKIISLCHLLKLC